MNDAPLLELRGISKRFPGVVALDKVGLTVGRGEIVALCGENGAGKSTLMKILGGVYQPDEGEIEMEGRPVKIAQVTDAMKLGIGFIHQELNILDNLDVAGNVFLGREPLLRPFQLIDRRKIHADTEPLLQRLGLNISSRTRLDKLSLAQQQLVEIAKALSLDTRLIIMDEPTSSLTLTETERLLQLVRELGGQGVSVIYISHRLGEVEHCADRVVVLRDGKNAGQLSREENRHDRIVSLMVGRDLSAWQAHSATPKAPGHFKVRDLRTSRYPYRSVSFDAGQGEILGFAGLVGAGRSEMAKAIVGLDRAASGKVMLGGEAIPAGNSRAAIARGVYLVPEDRRHEGLITEMSVRENTTLPSLKKFARFNLIRRDLERKTTNEQIASLKIKTPGPETLARDLSGGNQQKVVLGKWLSMQPKVMIFDEPTRGIDVGAKAEIYRLMRALADNDAVILMISSDMEEVLKVSDRVAVMHEGEIVGVLNRESCSEQNIMQMAVGRKIDAARPRQLSLTILNEKGIRNFDALVVLCVATALKNPQFISAVNLTNMANIIGMFGIFSLGAGLVIITGGIDLSVGSMIALVGMLLALALTQWHWPWPLATAVALLVTMLLGGAHGFLITRMRVQPFIVTLCGLLIYRGMARFIAQDATIGFGNAEGFETLRSLAKGKFLGVPMPFVLLMLIAVIMWFVLHRSIYGRYLLAVGRNEEAARFSGVNTRLVIASSYVVAGLLTGISAILFAFYTNSISPSIQGNFFELYGIAAAVLGGCSLRGGEGSIPGIIIGTALLQVLQNLVNLLGIDSSLNYAVMGTVVLIGVLADQILQNRARNKRQGH